MSASLPIIVLILAGGGLLPIENEVARSLREVFEVEVAVRSSTRSLSDAELAAEAHRLSADAAVEVVWQASDRGSVSLHVYLDGSRRWLIHRIHFDREDAESERARTIGFSIAALMPDQGTPTSVPPPASPLAPLPPSAPAPTAPTPTQPVPTLRPRPLRTARGAIDAAFHGAAAFGGYGGGLGGALAASWFVVPGLSARLGVVARVSEIAPAQANATAVIGTLGLRYGSHLLRRAPLGWGLRADLLALRFDVAHQSADDPYPQHESTWSAGASLTAEGTWALGESIEAVLGLGAETVFGQAPIYVHHEQVATVVPLRGFINAGVRVGF